MRTIVLYAFTLIVVGCNTSKLIVYQYIADVNEVLLETIKELEASNFAIKDGKKSKEIFALVNQTDESTIIVFNFLENMSQGVARQIKRSNRFIMIDNHRVPVIFYFDDGNSYIRTGGISFGIIGGQLIEFDESGAVLTTGPVY